MKKTLQTINNKLQTNRGFTLLELLLFMAIFSMLIVILSNVFVSSLDVLRESEATSSVDQDGRYLLSRLIYDVQRADSITSPSGVGQQGTNLQLSIGGDNFSYSLDNNGNLQLTTSQGTDNLNSYSASISAFNVTRLGVSGGKNTLQIGFTTAGRTTKKSGVEKSNYKTTIGTR